MKYSSYKTNLSVYGLDEYNVDGVRFLYKKGSEKTLFTFYSSFVLKGQKQQYNYLKLISNLKQSMLFFLDSETPDDDPRGTYYLGNQNETYLKNVTHIIQEIAAHNTCGENIFYFGSSKGATGALLASLEVGFGTVLINAPQVKIYDYINVYYKSAIVELGMDKDTLNNIILEKISSSLSDKLTFYITCGMEDTLHLNEHLIPLFERLENTNIKSFFLPVHGGHTKEAIDDLQSLIVGIMQNQAIDQKYKTIFNDIVIELYEKQYVVHHALLKHIMLLNLSQKKTLSFKEYITNENILNNSFNHNGKYYFIKEKETLIHEKYVLDYHYKYINNNSDKLVIILNGAIDRSIAKFPVFQRSSWADEIDANLLFINDPTINETNNLNIGWYVGNKEENAQYQINNFLKSFILFLNINHENVFFYGSSAGGLASMLFAIHLNVKCIVNNPQTSIVAYHENSVKQLINEAFNGIDKEEFIKIYNNRINVLSLMQAANRAPKVYYIQNISDIFHVTMHYKPFFDLYTKMFYKNNHISICLYTDEKNGHSPLSKDDTIKLINNIIHSDNKTGLLF